MSGRKFKRVAVLMGGPSAEREVSLKSGNAVAAGLRRAGYEVTAVDVEGRALSIPEGTEAVFIALHGEFGEDGEVQAQLDRLGMPYTGSGAIASRRAFDKAMSKLVFSRKGIPTPDYQIVRNGEKPSLPLPVVVKPACQGSSIGVHRVMAEPEWDGAICDAFRYGKEVVVEAYIPGRELTVGIVGDDVLPVIEIRAPDGDYDYRAKYTKGVTEYLVPAPLDEDTARACQSTAMKTYAALGCRGMGRVDIRARDDGRIFVLELNSIPGFTETSLLPKAAASAGIDFPTLCDRIMGMAMVG